MPKKIISLFVLSLLLGLTSPAGAMPNLTFAQLSTPGTQRTLALPPAADNSPVISLGTAQDPQSGETVQGYLFIHYKDGYTHKPGHEGGSTIGASSCYSYLAQGAKWKGTVEGWLMNPANSRGLDPFTVFAVESAGIGKWEDAADGFVGNGIGVDILGNGLMATTTLTADTQAPDGNNEAYFADVSSPGAIAVTIVWGIFSGPPSQRKLVEWDMVFDDLDFDWSLAGESAKMDFDNIATHELGHAVGMGHPSDSCTEETMYRFADFGETKKRDLYTGDIAGINKLY